MLTFDPKKLTGLLADAKRAWPNGVRERYGEKDPAGFWLVGDQGVYLMHNGVLEGEKPKVVYANECDPEAMEFDEWWDVKNGEFGGDDGVEFIEVKMVEAAVKRNLPLKVKLTPSEMALSVG